MLTRVEAHRRRVQQVKTLALVSSVLYVLVWIDQWLFHPPPVRYAWVDGVEIAVFTKGARDYLRGLCGWGAVGGLVLLFLLDVLELDYLLYREKAIVRDPRLNQSVQDYFTVLKKKEEEAAAAQSSRSGRHSLAPSGWGLPTGLFGGGPTPKEVDRPDRGEPLSTEKKTTNVAERPSRRAVDAPACLSAKEDLDAFLANARQSYGSTTHPSPSFYNHTNGIADHRRVRVKYTKRRLEEEGTGSPSSTTEAAFTELFITNPSLGVGLTREWVSEQCRALLRDVKECNTQFLREGFSAFDCRFSLSEVVQDAAPSPAPAAPVTRWGAPPSLQPAAPIVMTKEMILKQERERLRTSGMPRAHEVGMVIDQRLALEGRLSVGNSFPLLELQPERRATIQQYVLRRLQTFSEDSSLSGYNPGGGELHVWNNDLPCDAHILLHLLRVSVPGLYGAVVFGSQAVLLQRDLRLHVGSTTIPYFHVGFRDTVYPTHDGEQSLFEALLLFAGVVQVHFAGRYNALDTEKEFYLAENGLLKVLQRCSTPPPYQTATPSTSYKFRLSRH